MSFIDGFKEGFLEVWPDKEETGFICGVIIASLVPLLIIIGITIIVLLLCCY